MLKRMILITTTIFFVAGCSPSQTVIPTEEPISTQAQAQPTTAPQPTDIILLTNTPEPTATLIPSATPSPTAMPISIPDELKDQIAQSYMTLVLAQGTAALLEETALKTESGELAGFESFGAITIVAALGGVVDGALRGVTPFDDLAPMWNESLKLHQETKLISRRWFDKEIDSSEALNDIQPVLEALNLVLLDAEIELLEKYGIGTDEMEKWREEALANLRTGIPAPPTVAP